MAAIPGSPPAWLISLERALAADSGEESLATAVVVLASVAGSRIVVDERDLRAATRRALLLLAAGGDPSRGLDLNGRAVEAVAHDLDEPHRRSLLSIGVERVREEAAGLVHVKRAADGLANDPEVAWRAWACSLLAEALEPDE